MSGYTIVNLKEVEDQAPNFGLAPDFEARFARVALEAELVGLTYQRLAPNLTVPWGHTHKTQEEVLPRPEKEPSRSRCRTGSTSSGRGTRSGSRTTRHAGSGPAPKAWR